MKSVNFKIKEEIYKCSKCGLCKSVCPLFLATKNEMYSPRGRYIYLNNLIQKNENPSKDFIKKLDICLNCNLCKDFCPSNIDSTLIYDYFKKKFNYKYSFCPFYIKYFSMLFFYSLRYKKVLVKRKNKVVTAQKKAKVVYFQGCINKYVNQSDKNATLNLLDMLNYDVVKITNICCGLPYLSDCLHNKFDKNAKKIVNSIPDDIDYIVCSCDSCYETLKKIDKISSKLVRIDELLKLNQYKIKDNDNDNDINTYYYKPLYRKEDCYLPQNIKILNTNGTCSLIENFFVLKYPKIAKKIYESSFYKNNELNNKTLIFTSMLDYYFFKFLQKKEKKYIKVFSFSEYVKFDII